MSRDNKDQSELLITHAQALNFRLYLFFTILRDRQEIDARAICISLVYYGVSLYLRDVLYIRER